MHPVRKIGGRPLQAPSNNHPKRQQNVGETAPEHACGSPPAICTLYSKVYHKPIEGAFKLRNHQSRQAFSTLCVYVFPDVPGLLSHIKLLQTRRKTAFTAPPPREHLFSSLDMPTPTGRNQVASGSGSSNPSMTRTHARTSSDAPAMPLELFYQVFENLSPGALTSVARTSSALNGLTERVLYRRLELYSSAQAIQCFQTLVKKPSAWVSVQECVIVIRLVARAHPKYQCFISFLYDCVVMRGITQRNFNLFCCPPYVS